MEESKSPLNPLKLPKAKIESPPGMKSCGLGNENQLSYSFNQKVSGDLQHIDEKIKSLITLGKTMWKNGTRRNHACTVCGKEGVHSQIKNHIEAIHLETVFIPCKICRKIFTPRAALKHHISRRF